jgi:hypothetical protein
VRVVCKNKVRRRYRAKGLLAQASLRIPGGGTLRAKVLVFRLSRDLNRFWKQGLRLRPLGSRCRGAVNDMGTTVVYVPPADSGCQERVVRIEVDRRHFCVIGLVRGYCTMRILTHEAVHAGFAHAKRCRRAVWHSRALEFDEEAVAYPTGEIARALTVFLEAQGLLA